MSVRKCVGPTAVLLAGACCVVLLLARAETPPAGEPAVSLWGHTSDGVPVAWPAGINPSRIRAYPSYSPSGRYLGVRGDGRPRAFILDLDAGTIHDVYERIGYDRPNLQCLHFGWLSDQRVFLVEHWATDEELQEAVTRFTRTCGEFRYRVIDWMSNLVLLERPFIEEPFDLAGSEAPDQWIVRKLSEPDYKRRFWLYDPASESFERVLIECAETESMRYPPCGPWVAKLLIPLRTNPAAHVIDIEFVNYRTAQTRHVANVPPLPSRGPLITADGRYVITSPYSEADRRRAPIIFDTQSGQRHDLPSTESWTPVALSEARGVLLVDVTQIYVDGEGHVVTASTDYAEIPLAKLLPP